MDVKARPYHMLIFLLFACLPSLMVAQTEGDLPAVIVEIIEDHAENQDEEMDYSRLVDELNYYMRQPLNINTATKADFDYFVFLNDLQINDLFTQRSRLGKFDNLFQLQLVESLNYQDIQNLSHFIYVGDIKEKTADKLKNSLKYGRHDVFLRYERTIEQREGYKPIADSLLAESPNKRYLGSPDKYYIRYKYRSRNLRWGLNAEKDPGEEFFQGSQKQGFDFYSGFFMLEDVKWVDKLVVGDYNVEAAQGMALWSGLSFGKSSNVASVRKQSRGLKPSTSMNEFGYLRGVAAEKRLGPVTATLFYSRAMRDGNAVMVDSLDAFSAITSLQQTGYHNTQSLVEDKNLVEEQMLGGHLKARLGRLSLGATAYHFRLDVPLEQNTRLYKKFSFFGKERMVASVDYEYNLKDFIIFGETGYSDNDAWGTVNGFILRPASGVYLAVLHRWYQSDFQNIKGGAFGENSANQNENGLYTGIQAQLSNEWTINAYADHFRFLWLNYRADAPSYGSEYRLQLDYSPARNWDAYLRYQFEQKMYNDNTQEFVLNPLIFRKRDGIRLNISWSVNSWLKFNNRAEWTRTRFDNQETQQGYLIYQDILLRPKDKPVSVSLRYALFNTDSYDARLYAYEHDVLYAFSIPAYAYQGYRCYFVIKYKVSDDLDAWFKIARTNYANRESVGSGLTEIDQPHKTDVKIQLRFKF